MSKVKVVSLSKAIPASARTSQMSTFVSSLAAAIKAAKSLPITQLGSFSNNGMQKLKILVADDDAITLSVVSALLSRWGYEVISVVDGEQARNVLSTGGIRICILDWEMPALNGRDLCAWIRKIEL